MQLLRTHRLSEGQFHPSLLTIPPFALLSPESFSEATVSLLPSSSFDSVKFSLLLFNSNLMMPHSLYKCAHIYLKEKAILPFVKPGN